MKKRYIDWNFAAAIFGLTFLLNSNDLTKDNFFPLIIGSAVGGVLCSFIIQLTRKFE